MWAGRLGVGMCECVCLVFSVSVTPDSAGDVSPSCQNRAKQSVNNCVFVRMCVRGFLQLSVTGNDPLTSRSLITCRFNVRKKMTNPTV